MSRINRRTACLRPVGALAMLAVLAQAGCAGIGGPATVRFSQAELQGLLERSFPIDRRLLDVFDVSLATPRIELLPERNRLAVAVDIQGRDRLLGGSWTGVLAFDTLLRWDAGDQSVRLAQVRVQDFSLNNASSASRSAAERLGGALVERALEDLRLYQLPPERAAQLQARGVAPGAVTVTAHGVDIALLPLPR